MSLNMSYSIQAYLMTIAILMYLWNMPRNRLKTFLSASLFLIGVPKPPFYVLPTLWFRNTWHNNDDEIPVLKQVSLNKKTGVIEASHKEIGEWILLCRGK